MFCFFLASVSYRPELPSLCRPHLAAILLKQVDAIAWHIFISLIVSSLLDILLLLVCYYVYYLIIIIADI